MQETTKRLNTITIGSAMKYIVTITGILINYGIEFKKTLSHFLRFLNKF